ncbi:MAG: ABC transporter substrate-binding protein [Candidatus Bathyarchaeota archaeon]|nr:ABC transporter substrate-binding protein [Candidatus Bathyarchaeota archaeon]MDW8040340.1 ABC transporter substrate-binding protein [Nitrososphaerota archaeon]
MKSKISWLALLLASIMVLCLASAFICEEPAYAQTVQYGPRSDYQLFYYADESLLYSALVAGEIDSMMWELSRAQYEDAIKRPELILVPVARLDMRAWSLNNNYTIGEYPGVRNPLHDLNFRTALFHLTDVYYYTEVVCGGFATALHVPVAGPSSGWWNMSVVNWAKANLDFSLSKARAALAAGGFVDRDGNGIINYPIGWDGAADGRDLDPIVVCRRVDDALRKGAMDHLIAQMQAVGIPIKIYDFASAAAANQRVMIDRNYHIYAAGWSVGRYPTYLYGWFHSSRWFPGGSNYHTGVDKFGNPNYPDVDAEVDKVWYPPDIPSAMVAAKNAQYLVVQKYRIFIALWSSQSYYAYRNLLGMTMEQGAGPEYTNPYIPINAKRVDDPTKPIRVGIKNPPVALNHITSRWVWDVSTFRFMDSFMDLAPYNIMVEVPWSAQDWHIATWVDPEDGKTKSKVTYWIRPGQEWIEPVTGNVLKERDATDHPFSCWYHDACPAGWIYTGFRDIKYIIVEGRWKIDIYFDVYSYWAFLWPFGRDMYPPAWKRSPLATLETKLFVEGVNMTTPGELATPTRTIGTPVEVVEIKALFPNGTEKTLVPDTTPYLTTHTGHYVLRGSTARGPKIMIFTDLPDGTKLTAKYWARGDYEGFTPGGLPWREILIGSGPHYLVDLNPTLGGWATFKANRKHWMETPPDGEVDFWYYFIEGPKPRDGYYMVDIFDVVKICAAYDATGNGAPGGRPPSANWDSGADLAEPAGLIDIFDVVSATVNYEKIFGSPPPNPPP